MNSSVISQSSILRDLILDPTSIDQNLLCQELVIDPIECSQYQNLFCQECIILWLQKKKTCPYNCSNEIQLKNPIEQLKIQFLRQKQSARAKNLDSHWLQCEYKETKCPFPECEYKDNLKQVNIHQLNCKHRTTNYLTCEATYKINQEHDCLVYLLKKIKIQEYKLLAYQQKTDIVIMDLVGRLNQLEDQQKGSKNQNVIRDMNQN